MSILKAGGVPTIIHGSIVRGDVSKKSDVDIMVLYPVSSFKIELLLEQEGNFSIIEKILAQATPNHAIKGHIYLSPEISVTFPLVELREREVGFYTFGGKLTNKSFQTIYESQEWINVFHLLNPLMKDTSNHLSLGGKVMLLKLLGSQLKSSRNGSGY